ncbi:hypothetical protein [Segniliparus rugosus]|uniref:Uncharacterized protein n=1 Tax=Segniliparus rugosus (strain ATCC BAA-974 / DSM 45345 / CCUG 50838 / CIP 108380 / JCM 13579 / CDC 945) TaxID=679197 RepID=E5XU27_SEGRC|nr:hypothetical protein [Segniliparus rugosus]EFV12143.1 hypothetical protein HMPREF9336_02999 [Segniliparus rugosus ATCC BAA-974]
MLLPSPTIPDRQLAQTLSWVVVIAVPLLDRMAETDPLQLKRREPGSHGSSKASKVFDRAAALTQARNLPGTAGWDAKTVQERCRWWTNRIGAIGSAVASAPGVFGALSDRLPVQDAFGFATQATVLCAVAREHDVTDRAELVRMLGEVLCGRKLGDEALAEHAPAREKSAASPLPAWTKVPAGLWQIARIAWSITAELEKRPHGASGYRLLGKLPVVGVVGDFLYETGGVRRAAADGERWLALNTAQPQDRRLGRAKGMRRSR